MAPVRSKQTASSTENKRRGKGHMQNGSNALPGTQKIKASIRQTRRLLSKEKLAADVRTETERRLKSLESDLQKAELRKKERQFAVRYHKIKFFERQKVMRKINQTKKEMETSRSNEIESALYKLRVDLNYILHYPKTKKYISLFPPDVRKGENLLMAEEPAKTNAQREEIRSWIREKMVAGELPMQPEETKLHSVRVATPHVQQTAKDGGNSGETKAGNDIRQDTFFGDDGEESDESSGGSST